MSNGQIKDLAAPHDGSAPGGLLTLAHAIDESPALEESDDTEPLVIPMEDEGVSPLAESMLIEQLLAHSATEVVENTPPPAPADFSEPVSRNEPNPVEAEEFNYVDVAETEAAAGILEPHEVQAETFTVVEPVAETVEPVIKTEAQAEIATEPVEFPAEPVAETVEVVNESEALAETFNDAEPVAETVEPVSETEAQAETTTEPVEYPAEPVAETVEPVSETETLAETITGAETVEPVLETEAQAESVTEPVESPAEAVAETVEPVSEPEALAETFTDAEPVAETVEPVSATEAQAEIATEPVEAPAEPVAETVEPVSQTEAPVETITDAETVAETLKPVGETEAQAESVTEPVESPAEPVAETVESVSETEAPAETITDAEPVAETLEPVSEIEAQAETTTEPVESLAEPVAETVEPVSETEALAETLTDAEPLAETVEPVSETEAHAEIATEPVESPAEPVAETVEPAGETEAPARSASLDADDQTDTVEMPAGEFAPDQRAEIEVPEDSALKPAAIAGGVALAGFSTAAILAARRSATPETPAPSVPTSAIPAPPPPVGNRQELVPAVVVIPPPPGERRVAPAPRRVTIPGWLITILTAATVLAGFISLWLFFSTTPAQSGSPQTPPRAQNAATASIAPAAPSTLTKYLEVAGLRVTSDSGKKPTIQYVLVNHSAAELSEIKLTITVRSSAATSAQQAPLCVFTVNVPTLTAYESREFKTPIENPVNALELPDWNHLRAEVAVSGQ